METRPGKDAVDLYLTYTHGLLDRRGFLKRLSASRGKRRGGGPSFRLIGADVCAGRCGSEGRSPPLHAGDHLSGRDRRSPRQAGKTERGSKAAGGCGDQREQGPQRAHRGRREARRSGGFFGPCPRCPLAGRGDPGRREQGDSPHRPVGPAIDDKEFRCRRSVFEDPSPVYREGRRRGFLLGRRHGQPARRQFPRGVRRRSPTTEGSLPPKMSPGSRRLCSSITRASMKGSTRASRHTRRR